MCSEKQKKRNIFFFIPLYPPLFSFLLSFHGSRYWIICLYFLNQTSNAFFFECKNNKIKLNPLVVVIIAVVASFFFKFSYWSNLEYSKNLKNELGQKSMLTLFYFTAAIVPNLKKKCSIEFKRVNKKIAFVGLILIFITFFNQTNL